MISQEKLNEILEQPESSTIDFKAELYDFKNDKDSKNTAKFVKDVVSFCNTIRSENGFILFGVKETDNNRLAFVGLNSTIDDSIFQEKIKDKVFPRPFFSYYELNYKDQRIGVLEFPIAKYELPLTPVLKMKGLEPGKIYYRNGSSNTEANGIDVIRINDWLKSLPGNLKLTLSDKLSEILKRLTLDQEKLSVIISDLLNVSKIHNIPDLELFCSEELNGINLQDQEKHKYRIQKVFVSANSIETNPYSFVKVTANMIEKEMEKEKSFYNIRLIFNQSIVQIEKLIKTYSNNTTYGTIKMTSKQVLGEGDYDLNVYFFGHNIEGLYNNIRQKLIDEIMKI